jgi:hypothetical protein
VRKSTESLDDFVMLNGVVVVPAFHFNFGHAPDQFHTTLLPGKIFAMLKGEIKENTLMR